MAVISTDKLNSLLKIKGENKTDIIGKLAQDIGGYNGYARAAGSPRAFQVAIINHLAIEPDVRKTKDGDYKIKALNFWCTTDGRYMAYINKNDVREVEII